MEMYQWLPYGPTVALSLSYMFSGIICVSVDGLGDACKGANSGKPLINLVDCFRFLNILHRACLVLVSYKRRLSHKTIIYFCGMGQQVISRQQHVAKIQAVPWNKFVNCGSSKRHAPQSTILQIWNVCIIWDSRMLNFIWRLKHDPTFFLVLCIRLQIKSRQAFYLSNINNFGTVPYNPNVWSYL